MRGLDVAPISTIHAFCQRVLTEHAFASGRLLAQSQVESRTAFTAAFDDVIRSRLEGELGVAARGLAGRRERRRRAGAAALSGARACAASGRRSTIPSASRGAAAGVRGAAAQGRARRGRARDQQQADAEGDRRRASTTLHAAGHAFRRARRARRGCSPSSTRCVKKYPKDIVLLPARSDRLGRRARQARHRRRCSRRRGAGRRPPSRSRPRWRSASARWSRSALRARKRAAGLYDFDDMLLLVDEALRGPRGAELAAALRAALSAGAHRRVPGHRPGAVADLPHDLPRRRRSAAALSGRRSQAGDLRLPRRRRQHLRGRAATRWPRWAASISSNATSARPRRSSTPTTRSSISRRQDPFFSTETDRLPPPGHLRRQGERDRSTDCGR